MSQLDPYLIFGGNCADAMRFYEHVLGAKLTALMTFDQAPGGARIPPGSEKHVMHARLELPDRVLMASDDMPGKTYEGMKGFSLALNYPSVDEAKRIFGLLAEGGETRMALDKTFWAEIFGVCVDKFGTPWMVSGALVPM